MGGGALWSSVVDRRVSHRFHSQVYKKYFNGLKSALIEIKGLSETLNTAPGLKVLPMPPKKLPQGAKPSQLQATRNVVMAEQATVSGTEEATRTIEHSLSTLNGRFDKLEATLQAIQATQLALNFSVPPVIDRAHRVPQPKPPEGGKSRALIARVHFFQDKERILRLRQGRQLEYRGCRVLVFPDYTAEVIEQRQSFSEVMRSLRELKVGHALRFPARLSITHNGITKIFTSQTEAKLYVSKELRQDGGTGQD
ncbi:hypothetical protein IRJ41_007116 [Triplophysa rosa]|uniref:Transposase element L1Md-A101/L1Md-A102/L1Md-A2 n=1 Tax=Triplophysa rosa TaxID=992332 RepID=A0A9W7TIV1_TRIRA|nr:hypothetical protein IRJ41_007116 [Triplophysa rosa]